MIALGFEKPSFVIRNTLLNCDDFVCAHKSLSTTRQTSWNYYNLAGVKENEAVVIARDNWGAVHETWMNSTEDNSGEWFVV
jgi:hypothetical protein